MNNNVKAIASYMRDHAFLLPTAAEGAKVHTYMVGGAVRDYFMGRTPKDNDVMVTGISVDLLASLLRVVPGVVEVDLVGKSFGVFKVKFSDGEIVDVAVPRTEQSTGSGHKDFAVVTGVDLTVEDDLMRRDLTMNAIALEIMPNGGSIIVDPFDGRGDIADGLIKAVGNAGDRFTEDPLRILRAFRFMGRYGFSIGADTFKAILKHKGLLTTLSADRIGEELAKILSGDFAHMAVRSMSGAGVLGTIIPEWVESIGFAQNNPHHYATVDNHVMDAFEYVACNGGTARARIAVLLHDIAKPRCYKLRTILKE